MCFGEAEEPMSDQYCPVEKSAKLCIERVHNKL
jgi:hypothetical protein